MATRERQYLTAVAIVAGIITLIDCDGQLVKYRQRGIKKYTEKQLRVLMETGLLDPRWKMYKELPSNVSISFEDPEIMGRAQATYPNPEKIARHLEQLALASKSKTPKSKTKTTKK